MLIDSNSLIINGIKMAFYVTEVEFGYNKAWRRRYTAEI